MSRCHEPLVLGWSHGVASGSGSCRGGPRSFGRLVEPPWRVERAQKRGASPAADTVPILHFLPKNSERGRGKGRGIVAETGGAVSPFTPSSRSSAPRL